MTLADPNAAGQENTRSGPEILALIRQEAAAAKIRAEAATGAQGDGAWLRRLLSGAWLRPDPAECNLAWQALAASLPTDPGSATAAVVQQLNQRYDNLMAWQDGMVGKVLLYQAAWMVGVNLVALLLFIGASKNHLPTWLSDLVQDSMARGSLACAYWGVLGACIASLWQLVGHALGASLSPAAYGLHRAKPLIGAVLGPVAVLVLSMNYLTNHSGVDPAAAATAYVVAALSGMFERQLIQKMKDVADSLFGKAS